MKEVLAFIRVNKVEETKRVLELNGFFSYSWRGCLGRGREILSSAGENLFRAAQTSETSAGGAAAEHCQLIAKRFFSILVPDDEVSRVVKLLIDVNQTGNHGDGKIFVLKAGEDYAIRSGKGTSEI